MKTNLSLRLALCGAVALFTHTTFGQTWQTVDDYQLLPGYDSGAQAMCKDLLGNIYAAGWGFMDLSLDTAGVIKKSSDGGAPWSVIDAFSNGDAAPWCEYWGITSDAAGILYVVGNDPYSANGIWFVRRSLNGGETWSTVDKLSLSNSDSARAVATDAAGNVYVVGQAITGTDTLHPSWIIRKGVDYGTSWSTVDTFNPGAGASARGVLCHPTAGIFVAGYGTATSGTGKKTTTQQYWCVRRSQDDGATWTTVDAYLDGIANGIGADAAGNIHAVGQNGYSNPHWIVRKSANGGTSWTTVDDFQPCVTTTTSTRPYKTQTQCYSACARGFAADSNGNLFVVGYARSRGTYNPWVVRQQTAGTAIWQTVDTFAYAADRAASACSVVADNSGHVFVGGGGYDAAGTTGNWHWLVRTFPAP
jgi:hypothetical protein